MLRGGFSGTVERSRAAAKRRMRARCIITRPGKPYTDPITHKDVVPFAPVYGTEDEPGECWTHYPGIAYESRPEAAGVQLVVTRLIVSIPMGVVVEAEDVILIVSDEDNPQNAGTRAVVASNDTQSQPTRQRLLCLDIQAGR